MTNPPAFLQRWPCRKDFHLKLISESNMKSVGNPKLSGQCAWALHIFDMPCSLPTEGSHRSPRRLQWGIDLKTTEKRSFNCFDYVVKYSLGEVEPQLAWGWITLHCSGHWGRKKQDDVGLPGVITHPSFCPGPTRIQNQLDCVLDALNGYIYIYIHDQMMKYNDRCIVFIHILFSKNALESYAKQSWRWHRMGLVCKFFDPRNDNPQTLVELLQVSNKCQLDYWSWNPIMRFGLKILRFSVVYHHARNICWGSDPKRAPEDPILSNLMVWGAPCPPIPVSLACSKW